LYAEDAEVRWAIDAQSRGRLAIETLSAMDVADFDFDLPEELIAQEPAARGESRLLVLSRRSGEVTHAEFRQIGDFLHAGDLLVVNNTRVFPARLLGHRVPSGGAVECLLLREDPSGGGIGSSSVWEALMHPGQKLKPGAKVRFERGGVAVMGEVLARHFHGRRTIRLWTEDARRVTDAIDAIGHVPLPPYIHRGDRPEDRERYQTVYARRRGSVAAPTAGLHFTEELLAELERRGIRQTAITLHVGYGTFKPVRTERVEDHTVDPETFTVGPDAAAAITAALQQRRRVIAVGTTTVRALESLNVDAEGVLRPASGETGLFIYPGREFRIVSGLVTNFHLPRSSLLMLVSAFAGREHVLHAYREAVARGYRFYSYGDAMLIL
jgi:S-adenosylmethionine:tRNA ribosyltransferase-isomerase